MDLKTAMELAGLAGDAMAASERHGRACELFGAHTPQAAATRDEVADRRDALKARLLSLVEPA